MVKLLGVWVIVATAMMVVAHAQYSVIYPAATTPMPLPRMAFSMYTPSPPFAQIPGCERWFMVPIINRYSTLNSTSYPIYGWSVDAHSSQIDILTTNDTAGQLMETFDGCPITYAWTGPGMTPDKLVPWMSVAKWVISVLMAYTRTNGGPRGTGLFTWEDTVCSKYTAFCQNGKENITFEQLGSYTAGIPKLDILLELSKIVMEISGPWFTDVCAAVETVRPIPEFVGKMGYPAFAQGFYDGCALQNMDPFHRTLQEMLDQELLPLIQLKANQMKDTRPVEWYLGIRSDQTWLDERVVDIIDVLNPTPPSDLQAYYAYLNWANKTAYEPTFLPHQAFMNPEENILTRKWIATPGMRNKYGPAGFLYAPTHVLHYLNVIMTDYGRVDANTQLTTRENVIEMSATLNAGNESDYILQQNPPRPLSLLGLTSAAGTDAGPHCSIADGMFGSFKGSCLKERYAITYGNIANMPNDQGMQLIPVTTRLFNNGIRFARQHTA